MFQSPQELQTFLEKNKSEIGKLNRVLISAYAVASIRHTYARLMKLKFEPTIDYIMEIEVLTAGLIAAYGRVFTKSHSATKLQASDIPKDLLPIHNEIIALRNERYSHHGAHESIGFAMDVHFTGTALVANPQIQMGMWIGASKDWEPLFAWLDEKMFEQLEKNMKRLTKLTGIEWKMADGPAPPWIISENS